MERIVLGARVVGLLIAAVGLTAQEWRLPPRGAVEYRREERSAGSATFPSATAARDAATGARIPDRYFPVPAPAPWLCAGELAADRRGVGGPVRDLRDVLRAVAFDLRGRAASAQFARVVPYGDVAVAGTWRAGADGVEILEARLTTRPPGPERGEPREHLDRLRAFCVVRGAGTLRLSRRVDAALGVVRTFAGEIDLVVEEGDRRHRRLRCEDAWELVAVRHNQDADFRRRVAEAIAAGAGYVREALAEDRSFLDGKVRDERSYGSGRLALALLTLLHAHVPAADAVVQQGFAELRRRRLVDSYSLAAGLMALARLGAAAGGQLTARDREVAAQWLRRLLTNVDPRVDRDEQLRFNYVAGPRFDTSLQQYGLLGLCAAQRCGLEVEGAAFAAAARQLLAVQAPASARRTLLRVSYEQLVAAAGQEPEGDRQAAACRGFAYEAATDPAYGAMTAAGASGLLLARAGMRLAGHGDRALLRRVDDAVRDAFAWLAEGFSVRCNPGFAERGSRHLYYWLYCLERSCELDRVALLDGRDWYYEGALQLLAQQQPNGGFACGSAADLQLDATCFAVLFLAKAAGQAAVTPR